MTSSIVIPDAAALADAARRLRAGELVAFPTETVYGLGADADNPAAVRRIYAAKGRPSGHPLIVHLPNADDLEHWARDVPAAARALAAAFWPGPLTIVVPTTHELAMMVGGSSDTIGVRVPNDELLLSVLRECGPLAVSSANTHGADPCQSAQDVLQAFSGENLAGVLDGGERRGY